MKTSIKRSVLQIPPKLLIVDDDHTALEEMCDIMETEGWESCSANSIETALNILETDRNIRVVVTDVHFVDPFGKAANGIQFVSRSQARFPDRPLSYLVLSGDPEAELASEQVGALQFLRKPLLGEDLVEAVNKALQSEGPDARAQAQLPSRAEPTADNVGRGV